MSKLEVYTDKAGQHRWRLKASNGEIVAVSEGYTTRYSAKQSAQKVKDWASYATIVEIN
ncbi:MAG: YegP family protein [bacterium]|nr:YegP family protein [bacterium]